MRIPKRKAEMDRLAMQDDGPLYLTREGYNRLIRKQKRIHDSLPELKAELQAAQAMGDLSENAAYSIAKGRLRGAQTTILRIDADLKRAVVVEGSNDGTIQLGSEVTLEMNGSQRTWRLVGPAEANPMQGRMSHVSPLGEQLIGKTAGEKVQMNGMDVLIISVHSNEA